MRLRRWPSRETTWTHIRRNFFTGLVALLPAAVTAYIVYRVLSFLDSFLPSRVLAQIPGLGLVVELVLITLLGALINYVVGQRVVEMVDSVFGRTPLVRGIYDASKQMVSTFFGQGAGQAGAFRQVVLVPYPSAEGRAVAFVMSEERVGEDVRLGVFVPFSPPTGGMVLFFPRQEVEVLDMRVDEAMKMVLTGGALMPGQASAGPAAARGEGVGKWPRKTT
jgi:uncharacterized membrane protein